MLDVSSTRRGPRSTACFVSFIHTRVVRARGTIHQSMNHDFDVSDAAEYVPLG